MKLNWDDIPSLEGLGMDWEYKPETSLNKRAFIRLKHKDLSGLFGEKGFSVKVSTTRKIYTGQLLDISAGGLSSTLPDSLDENHLLKVGFFLGTKRIITKAVVRHTCKTGLLYTTGIKSIDLDEESFEYISELYASKILYLAR